MTRKLLIMILISSVVTIAIIYTDIFPEIGDPNSPANTHVSTRYLEEGLKETSSKNLVTGIIADYRGFDTLMETTVLFMGGYAVAIVLYQKSSHKKKETVFGKKFVMGDADIKVVVPSLIPVILIYGMYVLFHGEVSLGGGFQAGAIIALAYIVYTMIAGNDLGTLNLTGHKGVALASIGVMTYALIGVITMFGGGKFLDYDKLPLPTEDLLTLHSIGITVIEVGVALCVLATIITILESVLERNVKDGSKHN